MIKTEHIPEFMRVAIDDALKQVADEEFAKMTKRLEERRAEVIAGVILHIQKQVQMESMGQQIIITVRDDHKNI